LAIDSPELRKGILYNLLKSDEYCQKVLPFITKEYFQDKHESIIFEEIYKYYTKYNSSPKQSAIKIEVESRNDLTEPVYNETMKILNAEVEPISKVDFLVNKTEQWCQERAIVNAVYQAVNVIGGEDKKTPMSALPELLTQAISTSFDKSVGHDYINDADDRWEFYNKKEEKIPSGLEHFDHIMRGGFPSKTLGVIMAGTGVGKSLFMCSMSSNLVESGYNVLYITMEMAEEKIAQRIDQNLLNLNNEELEVIAKESFIKRFDNLKMKTKGQLVVKEYPTKSAHAGHFRALLKELKQKKDFEPDVVCIDYINICQSMSAGKNANSYEQIKSTAEELRALAMEFNVPVLTATQTNRTGFSDADVDMTSVSESFGLPMTADYLFAMTTNDKLRDEGLIRFTQLKNRYGDPAERRNWLLNVDYSKMRVSDLDHQPESIEAQNDALMKPQTNTKPIMDINWE
jgi:replicative DNA helicase